MMLLPALSDPVEDGGVAEDDGDAGEEEAKDEEELLRRLSVFLQDCARKCSTVKAQGAPNLIYVLSLVLISKSLEREGS